MTSEGVVHALRRLARTLVPGGRMIDLHPGAEDALVETEQGMLGEIDKRAFAQIVQPAEARIEQARASGLFVSEGRRTFEVYERFDSISAALAELSSRRGWRLPRELAARIRSSRPPLYVRERVVLEILSRCGTSFFRSSA